MCFLRQKIKSGFPIGKTWEIPGKAGTSLRLNLHGSFLPFLFFQKGSSLTLQSRQGGNNPQFVSD